jgi:hypothetical protein
MSMKHSADAEWAKHLEPGAEILEITPRGLRRVRQRMEQFGYQGPIHRGKTQSPGAYDAAGHPQDTSTMGVATAALGSSVAGKSKGGGRGSARVPPFGRLRLPPAGGRAKALA